MGARQTDRVEGAVLEPDTPEIVGWYPDPLTTGRFRFWDGVTWTDEVHGGAAPALVTDVRSEAASRRSIDSSRAWLLAGIPLLTVLVELALLLLDSANALTFGIVASAVATIAAGAWDSGYLKSRGVDVSIFGVMYLVPVYLHQRSRRLGDGQWLLLAWIVSVCIAVVGGALLSLLFVVLNVPAVESAIATDILAKTSQQANVACPSRQVYAVGANFSCTAVSGAATLRVEVHVEDRDGDVSWRYI
jgi:Protein of unknown function (DUF2510)/Domain of unknown function (DUF4333)